MTAAPEAGSTAKRRRRAALGSAAFFLAAPVTVAGLGPWLLTRYRFEQLSTAWWAPRVVGGVLVAAGLLVLIRAFVRFVVEGLGTPAPVAPTERLVVGGLYRYVRNPMYVAVGAVIVGQALLLGRPVLFGYAAVYFAAVASFVHLYEEPILERRYGAQYEDYRRDVRAWLPRRPR